MVNWNHLASASKVAASLCNFFSSWQILGFQENNLFACYKIIFVWKEDSFLSIFWSLQIKYLKNLYFVERYMNVKMEMQSMMKKKSFWKQDTLIKISPLINCNFIVVASSNNDIHVSVHSLIKINNAFFIKIKYHNLPVEYYFN